MAGVYKVLYFRLLHMYLNISISDYEDMLIALY